jgi:hypothetical protein
LHNGGCIRIILPDHNISQHWFYQEYTAYTDKPAYTIYSGQHFSVASKIH